MAPISEDQYDAACNVNQGPFSTGPHKKRDACRYYQTASCRRGAGCPFAHFSVASPTETSTTPYPTYQAEQMYTYHPLGQTPVYRPLGPQAHPVFLWQPYLPFSPSFDPRYGLACQAETLLDYPDDKSDPSSAESSSAATSRDSQLCMALDTAWFERSELGTLPGIASPPGNFGVNSRPEYTSYSGPAFPAVKAEYVLGHEPATSGPYPGWGPMVASSPSSLPQHDDLKKKPLAYKTKPCKFYAKNGKCTSGERCTFIHDPESKGNAEKSPTEPTPATDAKLPSKPLDQYEASRAKGFYPITWRVIGGGVMMGGQRKICPAFTAGHCKYGDDCALAHETEVETDRVGFAELKNEGVRKGDGSTPRPTKSTHSKRARSSSQRRKPIKASPPGTQQPENFPSTVPDPQRSDVPARNGIETAGKRDNEVVVVPCVRDTPTSPVHRRTQSLSMVVSSPPPLDATHPNYAAEL